MAQTAVGLDCNLRLWSALGLLSAFHPPSYPPHNVDLNPSSGGRINRAASTTNIMSSLNSVGHGFFGPPALNLSGVKSNHANFKPPRGLLLVGFGIAFDFYCGFGVEVCLTHNTKTCLRMLPVAEKLKLKLYFNVYVFFFFLISYSHI